MMNERKNILKDKSFKFAITVIPMYKILVESKKEFVLSKQLLRSGTSVGAMVREAQNAESKSDFIHKLAIAQKECDETLYWLELLKETDYIESTDFLNGSKDAAELLKITKSSIITTKQNTHHS
jgi:four helix bundle protein